MLLHTQNQNLSVGIDMCPVVREQHLISKRYGKRHHQAYERLTGYLGKDDSMWGP